MMNRAKTYKHNQGQVLGIDRAVLQQHEDRVDAIAGTGYQHCPAVGKQGYQHEDDEEQHQQDFITYAFQ